MLIKGDAALRRGHRHAATAAARRARGPHAGPAAGRGHTLERPHRQRQRNLFYKGTRHHQKHRQGPRRNRQHRQVRPRPRAGVPQEQQPPAHHQGPRVCHGRLREVRRGVAYHRLLGHRLLRV